MAMLLVILQRILPIIRLIQTGRMKSFNYDAPVQQHQLSINGGNDKMTYFLSLGYFNQEGIVGGNYGRSNYERLSVRSNSTYKVFEVERS